MAPTHLYLSSSCFFFLRCCHPFHLLFHSTPFNGPPLGMSFLEYRINSVCTRLKFGKLRLHLAYGSFGRSLCSPKRTSYRSRNLAPPKGTLSLSLPPLRFAGLSTLKTRVCRFPVRVFDSFGGFGRVVFFFFLFVVFFFFVLLWFFGVCGGGCGLGFWFWLGGLKFLQ